MAANARFNDVCGEYRRAGCCVKACGDLCKWAWDAYGALLSGKDMRVLFLRDGRATDAPILFAEPGTGPAMPTETRANVTKLYKLEPGTCVWRFDSNVSLENARVYAHRVVALGDAFLDWGRGQFLFQGGIEMCLAAV